MSLAKYDKYKDSGVDWLGDVPEHWEDKRIKDIFKKIGSGTTPSTSREDYYEKGNIFWLNTTDLNNDLVFDTKQKITQIALKESGLKIYPVNSLAIAMYGQGKTRGTVGLLQIPTATNQAACIMYAPKGVNTKYVLYWFIHKYEAIRSINIGATQPNMNQDFVKFLRLQCPPIPDQTAIASYLDLKTSAIDRKVALLEQKIANYQQLRKSLINESVCLGLDKNVKLKNSGIEWIGMIPEHWEVKRLKNIGYLYSGLSGKSGDDFNQEESSQSKFFIPFTNIANNQFINRNDLRTVLMEDNEIQNKVRKNDLFFLMSSENFEDLGKTALLMEDLKGTYLNSFCKGFRITNKQTFPVFINYLLNSKSFKERLSNEGKGFTRINLKMEKVTDFNIIAPPKTEQAAISSYLDEKTQKIDSIVSNIKSQIEILKELRKTLINDVVTGKIKVIQ